MRAAEVLSQVAKKPAQVAPVSPHSTSQFTHGIRALSCTEVVTLIAGLTDLLAAYDRVGEAA